MVDDASAAGGPLPTLDDLAPRGRRVLVRADLNVPLDDGRVTDDLRLEASLPTIRALRDAGARVILMSHLGRPKGEVREDLRLAPVAARLGELLGATVAAASDTVGDNAHAVIDGLRDGDVAVLENLRFDPREKANDETFARELASLIRKIARRRAEGREEPVTLTRDTVIELLGAPRHLDEEIEERTKNPGVAIGMARRRRVNNLLALAILTLLGERPMHPYEIATLLRERGKAGSIKINWGSLYTVVQNLEKHGFVEAAGTARSGRRPERTVYAITKAGRAELDD